MKKIEMILKNKKVILYIVILLVAFCSCLATNLYLQENYIKSTYFENSGSISTHAYNDTVIEQEFILDEDDEGIAVLFATYTVQVTAGNVNVEIYDELDNMMYENTLPATLIKDNQYLDIVFEDVAPELHGQKCTIRFTFEGIDGQPIAFYSSDADTQDCDYTINGIEQGNDLAVKGLNKTNSSLAWKDIRLIYLFVFIAIFSYEVLFGEKKGVNLKERINACSLWLKNNSKTIFCCIGVVVFAAIVSALLEMYWMQEKGYINPYRWFMFFVIISIVLVTVVLRNYIWEKAHIYYFVVSMLIGVVAIVSVPFVHISWDEQIHYFRTVYMSWGASGEISSADYILGTVGTVQGAWERGYREESIAYLNALVDTGFVSHYEDVNLSFIAYVPASIAMFLGRTIGFSFFEVYMLGKLANLFTYSLFIALAIKNFKSRGKILTAAVGLIPTTMFLASCYSYDWWVIALGILGMSMFIGDIQTNGYVRTSKVIQSVGVIILGFLTKAVYFPLMFPLMLLRKEKYEDSRKARGIVLIGMLFLMSTFVLPILFSGAGEGDVRGGAGVNSSEQVVFILNNVWGYAEILFNFLWKYLLPDNARNYLGFWAYLGDIEFTALIMIIICVATVVDNSEKVVFREKNPLIRTGNVLGVLGSLILVATALYISYTPVGLGTINGCQHRYILPIVFPFLFFTAEYSISTSKELKQKTFIMVVLTLMVIFMNAWNSLIICNY